MIVKASELEDQAAFSHPDAQVRVVIPMYRGLQMSLAVTDFATVLEDGEHVLYLKTSRNEDRVVGKEALHELRMD